MLLKVNPENHTLLCKVASSDFCRHFKLCMKTVNELYVSQKTDILYKSNFDHIKELIDQSVVIFYLYLRRSYE